ncbi:MAG TPA: 30S ribosomal protein S20 [Candidatus Pacebacteria bacterium]|nr:MAG: 30S ribosomal protein S20 [Microgenomates group bacterium GW2011_GWF1_44_10]OGJ41504.1 MAG: 30S ribosomal protein S20 [Candidatus Pacebacteria bacterium RIFOXYB1_FULL_44_10]HAU98857.1 30S ribosomal protein S20 [Candidatus Paceibacterota bacterium]HAX01185.1 30S ribosomal protein S20 [Candidatus Paceibacterota bacterium]
MPIIKSAIKALRQQIKKGAHNRSVKTSLRGMVKKARSTPTAESLSTAFSSLDRAVKRNIIHKNKAARMKSKLSKLVK